MLMLGKAEAVVQGLVATEMSGRQIVGLIGQTLTVSRRLAWHEGTDSSPRQSFHAK